MMVPTQVQRAEMEIVLRRPIESQRLPATRDPNKQPMERRPVIVPCRAALKLYVPSPLGTPNRSP